MNKCEHCKHLLHVFRYDNTDWFECGLIDDSYSQEVELTDSCNLFRERKPYVSVSNKVLVDKEKLLEDLRCLVGTCDICDMSPHSCKKEVCGYGMSDEKIEEILYNCMNSKETIE